MNISVRGKEPWFAVNLSMFFPGIGQIYSGNVRRGIVLIISYILLSGGGLLFSPTGGTEIDLVLLFATIAVYIWNLFDAHRCARKANNRSFEELRKTTKDPWLAVFLSRILPGIGHIYLGKAGIGILLVIIFIIFSSGFRLASIIPYCLITYDAYIAAARGRRKIATSSLIQFFIVLFVLTQVNFAPLIGTYVAEARYIASGSMLPTLQIKDGLIIDKLSYRFQEPQRGDIILFFAPERAVIC